MKVSYPRAVPLLSLCAIVAAATAVMLAVRFYLVEPQSLALSCAENNTGWRCLLREIAVFGFLRNAFGMTALVVGAIATVVRFRALALIAILSGVAGAVLYTFELSGVGLVLGSLVWVHRTPTQQQGVQQT